MRAKADVALTSGLGEHLLIRVDPKPQRLRSDERDEIALFLRDGLDRTNHLEPVQQIRTI